MKGIMATAFAALALAQAATASITGTGNVQVGTAVGGGGAVSVGATNNVFVGAYSMWSPYNLSGIIANVLVGTSAGAYAEDLRGDVFVGAGAGNGARGCVECVAIGVGVGAGWDNQDGRVAIGPRMDMTPQMGHLDTADLSVGSLARGADWGYGMGDIRDPDPDNADNNGVPWTPGTVRTGTVALETYVSNSPEGLRKATLAVGDDGRLAVSLNGMVANVALETSDPALDWAAARGGIDPGDTLAIYADGSRVVTNVTSFSTYDRPFSLTNLVAVYGGTNCVELGSQAFGTTSEDPADANTWLLLASFPSVVRVGHCAFGYCTSLKHVYLPQASEVGNILWNEKYDVFWGCLALEEIELPAATNLCYGALESCISLKRVHAPSVKYVKSVAFANCQSLEVVDFGSSLEAVPTLAAISAFRGTPAGCFVVVPDGLLAAWRADSQWSNAVSTYGLRIVSQSGYRTARRADIDDAVETAMSARLDGISLAFENGGLAVYTNGVFAISLGQ